MAARENAPRGQRAPPAGVLGAGDVPVWPEPWGDTRHAAPGSGPLLGPMGCGSHPHLVSGEGSLRRRPGRGWTALPDSIRQKDPGLTVSGKTPITGCDTGGLESGGPSRRARGGFSHTCPAAPQWSGGVQLGGKPPGPPESAERPPGPRGLMSAGASQDPPGLRPDPSMQSPRCMCLWVQLGRLAPLHLTLSQCSVNK